MTSARHHWIVVWFKEQTKWRDSTQRWKNGRMLKKNFINRKNKKLTKFQCSYNTNKCTTTYLFLQKCKAIFQMNSCCITPVWFLLVHMGPYLHPDVRYEQTDKKQNLKLINQLIRTCQKPKLYRLMFHRLGCWPPSVWPEDSETTTSKFTTPTSTSNRFFPAAPR